jgi:hypothetical protein
MYQKLYKNGEIRMQVMTFDREGECLPMHVHPPERVHNTMCMRGKILVYTANKSFHRILTPGEIADYPEGPHTIVGLEAGSMMCQMFLTPSKITEYGNEESVAQYMEGVQRPFPDANYDDYKEFLA